MPRPLSGPAASPFSGRIGIARVEITPPVGIYARNWGAAAHDVADSIHRPLFLTAISLSMGSGDEQPLVLIDADLGFWTALDGFAGCTPNSLRNSSWMCPAWSLR